MEGKVYTTQQVAHELGLSDSFIRYLVMKGKITPKERIGNTWVFTREGIEEIRHRKRGRPGRK